MAAKTFTKKLAKKPVLQAPNQFRRFALRRGPAMSARVRSFGGHQ